MTIDTKSLITLRKMFGLKLQENVRLQNFTTMNVGGPADALMIAHSADQLAEMVSFIWKINLPVFVFGSGSNLLVSDKGLHAVVIINHAHNIKVNTHTNPYTIWAESGALMVNLGKKLILRNLSGMEWAATIPGTIGGAVYGNAGAFGKDTRSNLISANILHKISGREIWDCSRLKYTYRASKLKRSKEPAVILSALFHVKPGEADQIKTVVEDFRSRRAQIQPSGPSVGSVFRNPPNDSAGRLIQAAGLKGKVIGGAIISPKHANFIINQNNASAQDVFELLVLARNTVKQKFNVELKPEIEILGEWNNLPNFLQSNKR
ncbi:MAG: UDP-N-acetylmuramate dehydrogenase [Anaerolineaceae bacterium]|nr:UDP-N-acetylmuramate dehydrogenase [Anaerolineaceae bacterium]